MEWRVECTFSDLKRMLLDILRAGPDVAVFRGL